MDRNVRDAFRYLKTEEGAAQLRASLTVEEIETLIGRLMVFGPAASKWTTKDGRRLHVRSMTSSHLGNTARMLLRNRFAANQPPRKEILAECAARGLMWAPAGALCACGALATMWSAPEHDGSQSPHCDAHRPDKAQAASA